MASNISIEIPLVIGGGVQGLGTLLICLFLFTKHRSNKIQKSKIGSPFRAVQLMQNFLENTHPCFQTLKCCRGWNYCILPCHIGWPSFHLPLFSCHYYVHWINLYKEGWEVYCPPDVVGLHLPSSLTLAIWLCVMGIEVHLESYMLSTLAVKFVTHWVNNPPCFAA